MFSRNQVFCLKNWKLWWAPATTGFNNFCWNFAHAPYLLMSTKVCVCVWIFFILLRTWVICQNKKRPGFYTLRETRFINISRFKQNKKNPTHRFVDIGKTETGVKFQQKILNSMVVGARQSFKFFRQITWFLGNKRSLHKFKYWILHHWISIIKLPNNSSVKPNFMLTTQATLISHSLSWITLRILSNISWKLILNWE